MKCRIKISKTTYGTWWVRSDPSPPGGYLLYVVVDTWQQAIRTAELALQGHVTGFRVMWTSV